jgi:hypothetical protein
MSEDPRCCGSGTCIIDTEGRCWCGQQWDGQKMGHAPLAPAPAASGDPVDEPSGGSAGSGASPMRPGPPRGSW